MPFLGWESTQDDRRVLLTEPAVSNLRKLAIDGYIALPRRGIEVGGILLGATRLGDIQIETAEEAPCEHRYGPSYALSPTDREALSALLATKSEGTPRVVGFFRSFTSRDPVIEEADEAFVRQHFPTGDFVYLMLQPQSARECLASVRLFRDGNLLPETEDPPFAFDPARMAAMEPRVEPPVVEPLKVERPLLPPPYRTRREEYDVPERAPAPRSRWLVPALICLASGLAGALIFQTWTAAREPHWTDLQLDARPVGGHLEVTWDPQAPRVLQSNRGVLSVTDGSKHREIPLDAEQIRSGKFTYGPSRGDVGLRLILYTNGAGVLGDMARISSAPVSPAPDVSASRAGEADRAAPSQRQSGEVAVPPSPVSEVQPSIPAGIRSRLTGRVVIPVDVEVSERGAVVSAAAESSSKDGLRLYLAEQARKAAMEWKFTPARSSAGTNVAATKTIRFVFAP